MKRTLLILLVLLGLFTLHSQDTRKIAFVNLENTNGDPQYDYMEGIIRGVLLFDLAAQDELELVTRSQMDAIMAEQQLVLSGAVQNEALEVGELLGADYLLGGEYIFLGEDVMINLWLARVSDGSITAYRGRGSQENFIHALCEEVILDITGIQQELESPDGDRSILSLKDVSPGSIALYTYIHDAEIYLDGQFVGYSTNNARTPAVFDNIAAGEHEIEVILRWFGVAQIPEFTFDNYREIITVEPGQQIILRPDIRHYNDWIYDHQELFDRGWYKDSIDNNVLPLDLDLSFINRQGEDVTVLIEGSFEVFETETVFRADLQINDETHELEFIRGTSGSSQNRWEIDPLQIDVHISSNRVTLKVYRQDIYGNMFLDEEY